jgi:hypothetical protein
MKATALLIAALFMSLNAAFAEAPQQNPTQPVPAQFQGDWNSKMEDCDSGLNDSALSIDAHWIRFYESGGPILAVIVMGKTRLSLIARLTSGEGGNTTWDAPTQYELSPNGAVLTDTTFPNEDHPMIRYKCPHHTPFKPSAPVRDKHPSVPKR